MNNPFGQSSNAMGGFGSMGFGQPQQQQQQQQQPQASNPLFGGNTMNAATPAADPSSIPSSSPFAMPSSNNNHNNNPTTASTMTGFGGTSTGFGQQPQQQPSFGGGLSASASPFVPSIAASAPTPAQTPSTGFGFQSPSAPTPSSGFTAFGTSSNAAPVDNTNHDTSFGGNGFSGGGFGTSQGIVSNPPFGAGTATASHNPFASSSTPDNSNSDNNSMGMGVGMELNNNHQNQNKGFGFPSNNHIMQPQQQQPISTSLNKSPFGMTSTSNSTINNSHNQTITSETNTIGPIIGTNAMKDEAQDKLAKLREKILKKKQELEAKAAAAKASTNIGTSNGPVPGGTVSSSIGGFGSGKPSFGSKGGSGFAPASFGNVASTAATAAAASSTDTSNVIGFGNAAWNINTSDQNDMGFGSDNKKKGPFPNANSRIPRKDRKAPQQQQQQQEDKKKKNPPHGRDRDRERQANNKSPKRNKNSQQHQVKHDTNDDDVDEHTKTLAERNAKRFATNKNRDLTSLLPPELQQRTQQERSKNNNNFDLEEDVVNNNNNDENEAATIGKCLHMCPDDELVRREKESDIQLLETPHEDIFPKEWTLRQTVVKRFRRSAADYTLNIPELVRPPHILELVCGYLEEWVMERDRQGVDPRFGQPGENIVPPPLDVYQFIWDRTRMVRKDFILQNYTGTGGECNAIAVRCHERIARWHCMCEHQLSHLPDFITMQSQQNIQELGQTMKTLNTYYDDADDRATKEDLNSSGSSSTNLHGCSSDIVMGRDPVDYDGKPLVNDSSSSSIGKRIVGHASKTKGTAEPEMRGLYILLTIDTDGGMEVLKYSARLSELSPEIFNSKPVQLALQVYKAKREKNYARFFSILRSPSTPYLFACIMFTFVDQMRKDAFRIMNFTFGRRKKDTVEGVYDAYPLEDLVRLLCFENLEEAKEACQHYNITVKQVAKPTKPNEFVDTIFWRQSDFKERRDPSKGNIMRLQPRKMNRVIESKLGGATKLAICRGEVSGVGATLEEPVIRTPRKSLERDVSTRLLERSESRRRKLEEQRIVREQQIAVAARLAEKKEQLRLAQAKIEEEARRQIEIKRKEAEAREMVEILARQQAKELEEEKQREEIERRKKYEAYQADLRREAEEKIRAQKKREHEAAEKIRIQQEIKYQQQQEIERKAAEELHRQQELKRKAEEERRRQQEIKRQVALELKRQKEEEALRLLEEQKKAEERRIEKIWKTKIETAKKLLMLRRWRAKLSSKRDKKIRTIACLENLDPTIGKAFTISRMSVENSNSSLVQKQFSSPIEHSVTYEEFFYKLSTDCCSQLNLGQMMHFALNKSNFWNFVDEKQLIEDGGAQSTFLFKLAIFVPDTQSIEGQEHLTRMIKLWIDSRFKVNHVHLYDCDADHQVRVVATFFDEYNNPESCDSFDAAILITPPSCSELCGNYPSSMEQILRISINLDDIQYADAHEFDQMLHDGCDALFDKYAAMNSNINIDAGNDRSEGLVLEKLSLKKLCIKLMKKIIWTFPDESNYLLGVPSHLQRSAYESTGDRLIEYCFNSLSLLFDKIGCYCLERKRVWPGEEFIDTETNEISSYFSQDEGLPVNWSDLGHSSILEDVICDVFPNVETSTHLENFLQILLDGAPIETIGACGKLYHDRQYRRCLEYALDWSGQNDLGTVKDYLLFLPVGVARKALDEIIDTNIEHMELNDCVEETNADLPPLENFQHTEEDSQSDIRMKKDQTVIERQQTMPPTVSSNATSNKRPSTDTQGKSNNRQLKRKKQGQSTFESDLRKSKNFTANLKS